MKSDEMSHTASPLRHADATLTRRTGPLALFAIGNHVRTSSQT